MPFLGLNGQPKNQRVCWRAPVAKMATLSAAMLRGLFGNGSPKSANKAPPCNGYLFTHNFFNCLFDISGANCTHDSFSVNNNDAVAKIAKMHRAFKSIIKNHACPLATAVFFEQGRGLFVVIRTTHIGAKQNDLQFLF